MKEVSHDILVAREGLQHLQFLLEFLHIIFSVLSRLSLSLWIVRHLVKEGE